MIKYFYYYKNSAYFDRFLSILTQQNYIPLCLIKPCIRNAAKKQKANSMIKKISNTG